MAKSSPGMFSDANVRRIRGEAAAGTLNPSRWADAHGCSIETIRRVARRESYRHVLDVASEPREDVSEAELAASLERLTQAALATPVQPVEARHLLDELAGRTERKP
jgi:hypothetical protein